MTREEIMAMEPGRELDSLVAEKVMNLCVLDKIEGYGDDCVVSDAGWEEWTKHPMCGLMDDPDFLPPYSTDISAAWEVFQEMKTRIFSKRRKFMQALQDMTNTGITVIDWPDVMWTVTPNRICKAALIACLDS